jgi:hypothetical protein
MVESLPDDKTSTFATPEFSEKAINIKDGFSWHTTKNTELNA